LHHERLPADERTVHAGRQHGAVGAAAVDREPGPALRHDLAGDPHQGCRPRRDRAAVVTVGAVRGRDADAGDPSVLEAYGVEMQLSAVSYQLSAISYQLLAISSPLMADS